MFSRRSRNVYTSHGPTTAALFLQRCRRASVSDDTFVRWAPVYMYTLVCVCVYVCMLVCERRSALMDFMDCTARRA